MSDLLKRKPKKAKIETAVASVEVPRPVQSSTTIRLDHATHAKLKALRSMGVGKTADDVVRILIDEYVSNTLPPDELPKMNMLQELYANKTNG